MTRIKVGKVRGDSAYEIAQKHGFGGSEEDWLDDLKKAEPGKNATINGVNTLKIEEGENIEIEQLEDTITISSKSAVESVNGHKGAVELNANDITFDDGSTFQEKFDAGELRGEKGINGEPGPSGEKGETGVNTKILNCISNVPKQTWTIASSSERGSWLFTNLQITENEININDYTLILGTTQDTNEKVCLYGKVVDKDSRKAYIKGLGLFVNEKGEPGPIGEAGPAGEKGEDGTKANDAIISTENTWSSQKIAKRIFDDTSEWQTVSSEVLSAREARKNGYLRDFKFKGKTITNIVTSATSGRYEGATYHAIIDGIQIENSTFTAGNTFTVIFNVTHLNATKNTRYNIHAERMSGGWDQGISEFINIHAPGLYKIKTNVLGKQYKRIAVVAERGERVINTGTAFSNLMVLKGDWKFVENIPVIPASGSIGVGVLDSDTGKYKININITKSPEETETKVLNIPQQLKEGETLRWSKEKSKYIIEREGREVAQTEEEEEMVIKITSEDMVISSPDVIKPAIELSYPRDIFNKVAPPGNVEELKKQFLYINPVFVSNINEAKKTGIYKTSLNNTNYGTFPNNYSGTNKDGILKVYERWNDLIVQEWIPTRKSIIGIYFRVFEGGSWSNWEKCTTTRQNTYYEERITALEESIKSFHKLINVNTLEEKR